MDDLLREFLTETTEHLDTVDVELVRFEKNPGDEAILRNIFRLVHTIKGTCGFIGLPRLESLAHAAETLMGQLRDGRPVTSEIVTLVLATVDRIKLILGELDRIEAEPIGLDGDLIAALEGAARAGLSEVGTDGDPSRSAAGTPASRPPASISATEPNQVLLGPLRPGEVPLDELERVFRETRSQQPARDASRPGSEASAPTTQTIRVGVDMLEHLMTTVSELVLTRNQLLDVARRERDDSSFKAPLQRLSHVTAELQESIMKARMQPIGSAWAKLPRVIRDLANELGKQIDLSVLGSGTELDRQILDVIRDPLTHMVRNAADHGIELPHERIAAGKPATGTIGLNAYHEGGTITIELSDDGRGLDLARIRDRAIDLGLGSEGDILRMSDDQIAEFIFHPGFSTAQSTTAVSGRGVGMDVVKTNIDLIGGVIGITSERGRGTTFKVAIPLTLAIVAALIVKVGGHRFALPQVAVIELVRVRAGSDQEIERINGAAVLRLRAELLPVFDLGELLEVGPVAGENPNCFVVVLQVGRQRFGLMVDAAIETQEIVVKSMCAALRNLPHFTGNTILGDGSVVLILDPIGIARHVAPEALWNGPDQTRPNVPDDASAETTTLLVFRGADRIPKAVPLSLVTRLEEIDTADIEWFGGRAHLQYRGGLMPLVPVEGATPVRREGVQPLIIFTDGEHTMALAVDQIVDIVDVALDIAPVPSRPDLIGSGVVRGRATEIVDIASYLSRAGAGWGAPVPANEAGPILLVEHNTFFRDLLSPVLKAAGHSIRHAADADEAHALLSEGSFEAAIVDLDGNETRGAEFVEALRGDGARAALAVIGLSSNPGPDLRALARRLGIAAIVAKFDRSGLMSALADATRVPRMAS